MDRLKIGVVVPMFGVAAYLRECLDSVMGQSYGDLSVLLVSDGDSACLEIALEYARRDARFIVIDKENGGQASARNVGIDFYAGAYEIAADSSLARQVNIESLKVAKDSKNLQIIESSANKTDSKTESKIIHTAAKHIESAIKNSKVTRKNIESKDLNAHSTAHNMAKITESKSLDSKDSINLPKLDSKQHKNAQNSNINNFIESTNIESNNLYRYKVLDSKTYIYIYIYICDSYSDISQMEQAMSLASEDIKVAVIVPIFNVEQYLGECLDSIVAQSYKNIQAILVNDGSTDASSLAIAREYVAKHANFVLIDKPNLGLSSARNVALDFLSQSYKLQLDYNTEVTDLLTYKVTNDNPYNIKGIYTSKDCIESKSTEFSAEDIESSVKNTDSSSMNTESNTLKIPQIDYIIFLDSDDYWRSDCIESCVAAVKQSEIDIARLESNAINTAGGGGQTLSPSSSPNSLKDKGLKDDSLKDLKDKDTKDNGIIDSKRAQIVWFEMKSIYDGMPKPEQKDLIDLSFFDFKDGTLITNNDFINQHKKLQTTYLCWVCEGLIDFQLLQSTKLRFIDKIIHEDHHFAMILFAYVKYMYIVPEKLYIRRVRPGSTTTMEKTPDTLRKSMPTYTLNILEAFKGDALSARAYYRAASWFIMLLEIQKFMESNPTNPMSELTKEQFLEFFINESRPLLSYGIDPLNLADKFDAFKGYITPQNRRMKLAINNPKKYKKLLPLLRFYDNLKKLERNFRKVIKRKKA